MTYISIYVHRYINVYTAASRSPAWIRAKGLANTSWYAICNAIIPSHTLFLLVIMKDQLTDLCETTLQTLSVR